MENTRFENYDLACSEKTKKFPDLSICFSFCKEYRQECYDFFYFKQLQEFEKKQILEGKRIDKFGEDDLS